MKLFNFLKKLFVSIALKIKKQSDKYLYPIYVKHCKLAVDRFYFKHLKYNKYFEEFMLLLKASPAFVNARYQKGVVWYREKTSPKQRSILFAGTSLLAIAWIGLLAYQYCVDIHKPRTYLGPSDSLVITPAQLQRVDPGPVIEKEFKQAMPAIGIVDYNQDQTVPVFTPYQGKIGQVMVKAGDEVKTGQVLYTVMVPDIAQAASTLLSSAGVLKMSNETLKRARALYETRSISLKELEQNISDQQTADANYKASLKSMSLFGLTDAQIGLILSGKKINVEMPVLSPVSGRVTARSAAPGLLVQPGNAPAPITVSNTARLWLVASVPESEIAKFRVGQKIEVKVDAFPDKSFESTIFYIGDISDPNTHRIALRADIIDEGHDLRPQMLAEFRVILGEPIASLAVSDRAVVRESDGRFSVWVRSANTTEFKRRFVKIGLTEDGNVQILEGLSPGEIVAQSNALFLSNLFVNLH